MTRSINVVVLAFIAVLSVLAAPQTANARDGEACDCDVDFLPFDIGDCGDCQMEFQGVLLGNAICTPAPGCQEQSPAVCRVAITKVKIICDSSDPDLIYNNIDPRVPCGGYAASRFLCPLNFQPLFGVANVCADDCTVNGQ